MERAIRPRFRRSRVNWQLISLRRHREQGNARSHRTRRVWHESQATRFRRHRRLPLGRSTGPGVAAGCRSPDWDSMAGWFSGRHWGGRRGEFEFYKVKVGEKERGEIVAPMSHRRPITGPDAVEQEHSTRGRDSAHHESGNHLHLCCILLLRPPETSSHLRNALLNRSRARSRLAACSTIGFGYPFFSAVFPAPRS